jgi:SNF2 family DNA or RNA helicase
MLSDQFKTKPFKHQIECLNKFGRFEAFALLAEQGTGKTWIVINNVAQLWASGDCDGLLVFAPNGVHHNWVLREIPTHMPDWVRYTMAAWSASPKKQDKLLLNKLMEEKDLSKLRILCVNAEALQHKRSVDFIFKFAASCSKLMTVADESTDYKNPSAGRTKNLQKLKERSKWRRIMNGTPVPNGPFDAFSQFAFLDEKILQTTSFYAFKAEYAEILQPGHHLLDHIMKKKTVMKPFEAAMLARDVESLRQQIVSNGRQELIEILGNLLTAYENEDFDIITTCNEQIRSSLSPTPSPRKTRVLGTMECIDQRIAAHSRFVTNVMNPRRMPQIVDRDKDKNPKYRNLDKLQALIAPYSFRVLKKDCLDLPDKIYKTVWFDLTTEQQVVYDKAHKENRLALNGEDTAFNKLVAQMKLMQITSGYYLHPDQQEPVRIPGENPKLALLVERVVATVESGEKAIVWARYRIQIEDVVAALKAKGLNVVQYHGGVNKADRDAAIEAMERGEADVFVGQQQAGGRGLTLVSVSQVFYYSNTYALDNRLQSEDRAHRIGQTKNVVYTDLCARDTIDMECIERLHFKEETSKEIVGDK